MYRTVATITLPDTEPRHWEGGDVAGKTFDILRVRHDLDGGYIAVTYQGHYFQGLAYLDLGTYRIRSRRVVPDYAGMRGAMMDRKPAEGTLDPLTDLLTEGTAAVILLESAGYQGAADRLTHAVNDTLAKYGHDNARLWGHNSEPDLDSDIDLSELFTPLEQDD